MKRIEISYKAKVNDYEKAEKALDRATKNLEKKLTKAEKLGIQNWTSAEYREWVKTVKTNECGWILNKKDQDKNGTWFDLSMAQDNLKDAEARVDRAKKALEDTEKAVEAYKAEIEQIEDAQQKEALWQKEFEEEQREWAKDGIKLEARYYGETPKGEGFYIGGNNGFTDRSSHCYTLTIGKRTVFTSGEFWRCYMEIKRS